VPEARQVVYFKSKILPAQFSVDGPALSSSMPSESFEVQIIKRGDPVDEGQKGDFVIFGQDSVGVSMPADVSMYGLLDPNTGVVTRRSSQTVVQRIVDEQGVVLGRLIISDGPAYGDEILNNVMNGWVSASIVAVVLAALAGWFFSNRITLPITALTQVTSRMAGGDLTARADVASNDEMGVLGRSFNEMAVQVEEMVGTLRSFVADAAHELHTPLTALQTNLELAREGQNASDSTLYLSRAQEQSQRLEALVSSLLELSRVESAEAKSNTAVVNVSQIIRTVAEQFASRAEQSNRLFTLELPAEEIEMMGNDLQLQQVFVNLLGNAIKFTRPDDSIRVSVGLSDANVNIEISDTGIGIPVEDLPHLFKRFHRGRNVSEFSGNGLGLAIVKAIVEGHGGQVDVASNGVGHGSIFTVTLPARL
jgi:signal transduction histidine kinase